MSCVGVGSRANIGAAPPLPLFTSETSGALGDSNWWLWLRLQLCFSGESFSTRRCASINRSSPCCHQSPAFVRAWFCASSCFSCEALPLPATRWSAGPRSRYATDSLTSLRASKCHCDRAFVLQHQTVDKAATEFRYKAPLLRGMMDPSLDKHEKIETLIATDVDNWLCNLYFELVRLPR